VQQARGNLDGAEQTYRKARDLTLTSEQPAPLPGAIVHLGLAQVAYQRGELIDASEHITRGVALGRKTANASLLASALITLAWIRQAEGDPAGARAAMGQAEEIGLGSEVVDLINPVPARRARLFLVQGDVEAAAAWTAERSLSATDDPSYAWEPAYLTLARVLRAQGHAKEALGLLDRLHARATEEDRKGSVIEIQALRALALADRGDEAGAVSVLTDALALAHPQRYVRLFADEGPVMGALLGRVLANQRSARLNSDVPAEYVARLVGAIEPDPGRPPGLTTAKPKGLLVPGLIEALSVRELEVMQLLAAGKTNREIADELYVTLHTVKKHITHILGKLGAANRTEAAARAREFGLLAHPTARFPLTGSTFD
jgi:LuxR family maltose regulon positive regulatory protein